MTKMLECKKCGSLRYVRLGTKDPEIVMSWVDQDRSQEINRTVDIDRVVECQEYLDIDICLDCGYCLNWSHEAFQDAYQEAMQIHWKECLYDMVDDLTSMKHTRFANFDSRKVEEFHQVLQMFDQSNERVRQEFEAYIQDIKNILDKYDKGQSLT